METGNKRARPEEKNDYGMHGAWVRLVQKMLYLVRYVTQIALDILELKTKKIQPEETMEEPWTSPYPRAGPFNVFGPRVPLQGTLEEIAESVGSWEMAEPTQSFSPSTPTPSYNLDKMDDMPGEFVPKEIKIKAWYTADVWTRGTMRLGESTDDGRIDRETMLEVRTNAKQEVQGLRVVPVSALDAQNSGDHRADEDQQPDSNGVLLLGGDGMPTHENHHTGIQQLRLPREVQGLRQVGEGGTTTMGRSGEAEGEEVQVSEQRIGDRDGDDDNLTATTDGGVRSLQAMAGEPETASSSSSTRRNRK